MIDLHTHTFLSDGLLVPSELVRRAEEKGCRAIALTDHVDGSCFERIVKEIVKVSKDLNKLGRMKVIPGVEITHVPPKGIKPIVKAVRKLGAKLVVAHGETIVEPVIKGTNKAAIEACVDILAHPGLISESDVKLAKERSVYLEITARMGHSLTNGHVAKLAKKIGAKLVFSTDAHAPSDLVTDAERLKILCGCGLDKKEADQVIKNTKMIVNKL